ncbi:hypothetical protein SAMN04488527_10823 [Aliiroseovarius crassostreae]|uniref:Uncharacterized protein n=1 Tax=Aliiroseovarius crassostreae TaxID=154981 RepID=A0A0P7KLM7_9RHOB|nr:hypothetical protein [Aliiroseovarius crassostreae]KPN64909.1 hypothetical protein AKJ29_06715 [Aliiroseovarius crassostreae]SFU61230.1 hypothetical protein SAMN04488527_10823 [Aliiroseovarius crassostreae]
MELTKEDLPEIGDRNSILEFAAGFNGYTHFGSFGACSDAAWAKKRETLIDLRNELFFSYRASNHLGTDDFVKTYADLHPYFLRLLDGE